MFVLTRFWPAARDPSRDKLKFFVGSREHIVKPSGRTMGAGSVTSGNRWDDHAGGAKRYEGDSGLRDSGG